MPIALDPAQTVDFSLEIDAQKPADNRPAFVCRFLTCKQVLTMEKLVSAAADVRLPQEPTNALLNRALAIPIVGWRNLRRPDGSEIPFAVEQVAVDGSSVPALTVLDEALTAKEKWELITGAHRAIRLGEDDRKKSASPSPTASAPSAPAAETVVPNNQQT